MKKDELRNMMYDFIQVMKILNRRKVDIHQYPQVIMALLPSLKLFRGYELDFFQTGSSFGSSYEPYVCKVGATEPYIPTVYEDGTPVDFKERHSYNLDLFSDKKEELLKIHVPYDESKRVVDMLSYDEAKDIPKALSYFRVPFSESGIMQAWLLENISNLLPLNWHSAYNKVYYILNEDEIEWGMVDSLHNEKFWEVEEAIYQMDRESLYPTVKKNGNEALLTVTYWNAWSGLVRKSIKARRKGWSIGFDENEERRVLVPYKTGIRF